MKVFLSWSGERSKQVATALRTWLPDVMQELDVWMSSHDLDAGLRWGVELSAQLETTNFGVLCLTPENIGAPWLLFEAGSLTKVISSSKVAPYRLGISATDVPYPLAQFQGVDATEDGTVKLLESLNQSREKPAPAEQLKRLFEKWWPDLKEKITRIPKVATSVVPQRSERALMEEILQTVRQLSLSSETVKNSFVTMSAIPNVTVPKGMPTAQIPFTVIDGQAGLASDLVIRGRSSNRTLVPDSGIILGGAARYRNVIVLPAPDQTGIATITIKAIRDDDVLASTQFKVTVLD